ncbi:MAG: hypothetical protein QM493_11375 [Sulfurovum sp.]
MRYPSLNNGYFLFFLGWVSLLPLIFYISQQISSYYYLLITFDIIGLFIFLFYDILAGVFFALPYIFYNYFISNYTNGMRVPQNCARILRKRDKI